VFAARRNSDKRARCKRVDEAVQRHVRTAVIRRGGEKQILAVRPSMIDFLVVNVFGFPRLLSGDKHLVFISQNGSMPVKTKINDKHEVSGVHRRSNASTQ